MFRVPENKIHQLLDHPDTSASWQSILDRVSPDTPLDIESTAILIHACKKDCKAFDAVVQMAAEIRNDVYGYSIKLFVPVYLSNACINECMYCAYRAPNPDMPRRTLTPDEFRREIIEVTRMGYRVIELVTSESLALKENGSLARYVSIARDVLDNAPMPVESDKLNETNKAEIILMSWTLSEDEFRSVHDAGLDAFYLWQETYNEKRFSEMHPQQTPKADFCYRLEVFDRAIESGIRKIGMGVLFGLSEWEYDVLALILHGRYLEETYGVTPDAIGVPRFKYASGAPLTKAPYPVSDDELRLAVAIYRLAFPHSQIFLNTREKLNLILQLLDGGGSEMNIACAVYPGGYTEPTHDRQFDFFSYPTDKTLSILREKGYQPTHFVTPEAIKT